MRLTKKQLQDLEKRNARIEKRYERLEKKMIERGKKKQETRQKKIKAKEQKKEKQIEIAAKRKEKYLASKKTVAIVREEKRLQKEQSKSLAIAFGGKPKNERKLKKDPEDFKGYYFDHKRQKFRVQFRIGGKQYRLNYYNTPEEAHAVYLEERAKRA